MKEVSTFDESIASVRETIAAMCRQERSGYHAQNCFCTGHSGDDTSKADINAESRALMVQWSYRTAEYFQFLHHANRK